VRACARARVHVRKRLSFNFVHFAILFYIKASNVFCFAQIKDSRLHFRYNLNSLRTEEKDIWLSAVTVGDGQWHTAKVSKLCMCCYSGTVVYFN
jgi:hypothetical protein